MNVHSKKRQLFYYLYTSRYVWYEAPSLRAAAIMEGGKCQGKHDAVIYSKD
jgi:hypothetical protein